MLKMSRALSSPRCVLKSQKMNGFPWETGYRSLWGLGQGQRQLHKELGISGVTIAMVTAICGNWCRGRFLTRGCVSSLRSPPQGSCQTFCEKASSLVFTRVSSTMDFCQGD
ncbi:uncharacterized [Tachysurus ichikawai]